MNCKTKIPRNVSGKKNKKLNISLYSEQDPRKTTKENIKNQKKNWKITKKLTNRRIKCESHRII